MSNWRDYMRGAATVFDLSGQSVLREPSLTPSLRGLDPQRRATGFEADAEAFRRDARALRGDWPA